MPNLFWHFSYSQKIQFSNILIQQKWWKVISVQKLFTVGMIFFKKKFSSQKFDGANFEIENDLTDDTVSRNGLNLIITKTILSGSDSIKKIYSIILRYTGFEWLKNSEQPIRVLINERCVNLHWIKVYRIGPWWHNGTGIPCKQQVC